MRFIVRNFCGAVDHGRTRLLELGCGPGANLWFMAREGFEVAGIDGSPTAIEQANERLGSEGKSADLRIGDYTNLPWPDDSFDGVVENVSLCCNRWVTIQSTLREVYRVLKPGAPFLSSFFTERTWGYGLGTEIEPDGFQDITEGPLANTGFCLFLNRTRLNELFSDFADVHVERVSRTMEDEQRLIEQFVIICRKVA